jgi:hypothetical protein
VQHECCIQRCVANPINFNLPGKGLWLLADVRGRIHTMAVEYQVPVDPDGAVKAGLTARVLLARGSSRESEEKRTPKTCRRPTGSEGY